MLSYLGARDGDAKGKQAGVEEPLQDTDQEMHGRAELTVVN